MIYKSGVSRPCERCVGIRSGQFHSSIPSAEAAAGGCRTRLISSTTNRCEVLVRIRLNGRDAITSKRCSPRNPGFIRDSEESTPSIAQRGSPPSNSETSPAAYLLCPASPPNFPAHCVPRRIFASVSHPKFLCMMAVRPSVPCFAGALAPVEYTGAPALMFFPPRPRTRSCFILPSSFDDSFATI